MFLNTPNISLLNAANPEVFEASFRGGQASYRLRGGLDLGSGTPKLRRIDAQCVIGRRTLGDVAPELFLGLQNYLGSSGDALEIRFVLTRS